MGTIRFCDYLKDYLDFNNISNKDFAVRIGVTPKHLIDILSGKCELSSQAIESISIVTNISSDYIHRIELNYKFESVIINYLKNNNLTELEYLNKYSYQYLIKNKWIDFIDKTNRLEMIKDVLKFLRVITPENVYKIDTNIFYKSKNDKPELLLLWLEKCYRKTLNQNVKVYKKENIETLVDYIKKMAIQGIFDEKRLIKEFNEAGIALVIQEDIPGTKVRGAFRVHKDMPSIYITYKHNRIADIYFALLHELAHCKTDFNKAKSCNIISYDDEIEKDADTKAYEWMVEKKYYNNIINNKTYKIEEESIYPKSFIVYRLAKDKYINYSSKIYQKYNVLLKGFKEDYK